MRTSRFVTVAEIDELYSWHEQLRRRGREEATLR